MTQRETTQIPPKSAKENNTAPTKPQQRAGGLERVTSYIELISKIFGLITWPVVAIAIVLLFYGPIRKMADMLPDKFEKSSEISVAGIMSLKLQEEAKATGNEELAAIIRGLSQDAIKWLLQIGEGSHRVVGSDDGSTGNVTNFTFPEYYPIWKELEAKGLLKGDEKLDDFEAFFQSLNPKVGLVPNVYEVPESSLNAEQKARLLGNSVDLTDSGKKAYNIIIKVVADLITEK